jgi:hypothetical protein
MTEITTSTNPERKQTSRPSMGRIIGSKYVDLLISGFISWLICFTFGWQTTWPTITLFLWVGEMFWCRDRLVPTVGEYCLGIRYLTSSSSQVVADIQVIHAKLKLNSFLLLAGIVELTAAFFFFCGWTFVGKAVVSGVVIDPGYSLFYWALVGFAFFVCSGYLLNGSKLALPVVPVVHGIMAIDFARSYPVWKDLMQNDLFYTPWIWGVVVHLAKSQPMIFLQVYAFWSVFVVLVLYFSRKLLVN